MGIGKTPRIALIDDDAAICATLELHFRAQGMVVELAHSAEDGLAIVERRLPDAVISDIRMPGRDGLSLLGDIQARWPNLPVIMITAFHDLESTIAAMQGGAVDYIPKPIDLDELDAAIKRALLRRSISTDAAMTIDDSPDARSIVGISRGMQEVFKSIALVARSRATVLVTGESGTGKELVARAIHDASPARGHPFLAINCAALVEDLLENELFGHEKGAYTGAVDARKGKVELAGEGSLFLDEIAELSPRMQSKLLRLLEQREFIPVGGSHPRPSHCRFITATNVDLEEKVKEGTFRADLFYRLHVVAVHLPSLRDRPEDIPPLIEHLLKKINRTQGRRIRRVPQEVMEHLAAYPWPGNVRQLENTLTKAVVMETGDTLTLAHLPAEIAYDADRSQPTAVEDADGPYCSLRDVEREHIERVLAATKGHKGKTCEILGISRPTLDRKIKEFGLGD